MKHGFQGETGPMGCSRGGERFHRGRGPSGGLFGEAGHEWPGMGRGHRHGRRRLFDASHLRDHRFVAVLDETLVGWAACDRGRPRTDLLGRVRHLAGGGAG